MSLRGRSRDVDESVRGLVDLYFRWVSRGEKDAAAVLGDALAERGYDVVAERIAKMLRRRRIGGTDYDHLRFDVANILLQIAREASASAIEPSIETGMIRGFEDAIWLPTWTDVMEATGRSREVPRNITRASVPEIPLTGREHARRFALAMIRDNRTTLTDLWRRASVADGARVVDPEELGYYLAMEAQGHGVGWTDDHEAFDVELPRAEWYAIETGADCDVHGYP